MKCGFYARVYHRRQKPDIGALSEVSTQPHITPNQRLAYGKCCGQYSREYYDDQNGPGGGRELRQAIATKLPKTKLTRSKAYLPVAV